MVVDPKWVSTLIENDYVVIATPITFGFLLIIRGFGWLPPMPWWAVLALWAGLIFFILVFFLKLFSLYMAARK